jgi:hypothetical protein
VCLAVSTSLSRAPGTTAPLGSVTTPEMLPPVAAQSDVAEKTQMIKISSARYRLTGPIDEADFGKNTNTSNCGATRHKRLRANERSIPFPRGVESQIILGRSPDLQAELKLLAPNPSPSPTRKSSGW